MALTKEQRRLRIRRRIRKVIKGTAERPRLSVFRSNKNIYAQLIDDVNGITLASAGSLKDKKATAAGTEQASFVGKDLAAKAKKAGIETCIFDRGGYLFHGRVKALADAAREGGLKF